MIVWGSKGQELDLGVFEERDCETCGTKQPFRISLAYKTFHLYGIFKCVTGKNYFVGCEVCHDGWELESRKVEAALGKSPIPAWDRYGLAALGVAVAVSVGVAIALTPPPVERDVEGAITTEGNIDAFRIQLGDCFNDDSEIGSEEVAEFTGLDGIPCSEPHDNEVYAVLDVPLASFPGDEEIGNFADEACLEQFETFVGRSYETSTLDIFPIYPNRRSWSVQGDREVICAVFDINLNKLEGSVKGLGL